MAAPKGNQFWKARTKHGRDAIFADPLIMWDACQEYFEWVEANPLMEAETVKFQGAATLIEVPKMRAMTVDGLCLFLGIGVQTWHDYRAREDFTEVTSRVDGVMRSQKFEGAAADLLNANIIARDLGLADKKEHTGKDGGPIDVVSTARQKLADQIGVGTDAKRS